MHFTFRDYSYNAVSIAYAAHDRTFALDDIQLVADGAAIRPRCRGKSSFLLPAKWQASLHDAPDGTAERQAKWYRVRLGKMPLHAGQHRRHSLGILQTRARCLVLWRSRAASVVRSADRGSVSAIIPSQPPKARPSHLLFHGLRLLPPSPRSHSAEGVYFPMSLST